MNKKNKSKKVKNESVLRITKVEKIDTPEKFMDKLFGEDDKTKLKELKPILVSSEEVKALMKKNRKSCVICGKPSDTTYYRRPRCYDCCGRK